MNPNFAKFRTASGSRVVARPPPGNVWNPYYTRLNAACMETAKVLDAWGAQHAFVKGRSQVTNAAAHMDKAFTLSFELSKFFDCVTYRMMVDSVAQTKLWVQSNWLMTEGKLVPGIPTTPAVSNIIASNLDNSVDALNPMSRFGRLFVYTRWGPRLYFSFNGEATASMLMRSIPELCQKHGYTVDHLRTRLQCASSGRRIITGIAVDDRLHPTRKSKRRYRAAKHQNSINAFGYSEWLKLKWPKNYDPSPPRGKIGSMASVVVPTAPASDAVEVGVVQRRRKFDL